ncbi:MAG TPA: polysaccharide deacetylase family protein [Exilispira sp.]|nr:polysaccharide deacetylase family protein [Exilispira sp.]
MKYLYDNNFTTLFASEVVKLLKEKTININDKNQNIYDQKENKKYIAITFDDGNDGVFIYADKIISKYGFKATFDRKFVTKNTDLYKIPRFIIARDTSFEKFIKIVNEK